MFDLSTGRQWNERERTKHINYLELKAVLFALQSFCKEIQENSSNLVVCDRKTNLGFFLTCERFRQYKC